MSVQDLRVWLGATIESLDNDDLWTVDLSTWPELKATYTVQVGHAAPNPDNFAKFRAELPVTWWVNEANKGASAADLYEALSWAPDSLVGQLAAFNEIKQIAIDEVGPDDFGRTGFLRAVSTITVRLDRTVDLTPIPEEGS